MPIREIEKLLLKKIGLVAESIGESTLVRAIQRRVRAADAADPLGYLDTLRRDQGEVDALVEEVVVRNSWFFREPRSFDLLREIYLEQLTPKKRRNRPLRILSLGCAGGEEPYTVAMTLLEAGCQASNFKIDAVDISQRALEIARRMVYRSSSFFGEDLSYRDRFFERQDQEYRLKPFVAEPVTFIQGNVLTPTLLAGSDVYHMVFCRNLLIYFSQPARKATLDTIDRVLLPGGTLFLGSVDRAILDDYDFESVRYPGAFAQRKRADTPTPAPAKAAPARPRSGAALLPEPALGDLGSDLLEDEPTMIELQEMPGLSGAGAAEPAGPIKPVSSQTLKPVASQAGLLLPLSTRMMDVSDRYTNLSLPCWQRIGIFGDVSCKELARHDSCYTCPTFREHSRELIDRPPPPGYREHWSKVLGQPVADDDRDEISVLPFRLWDDWFAISVANVIEITNPMKVHSVPNRSDRMFRGLVNVTGSLRLCISLHEFFELIPANPWEPDGARRAIERMLVFGAADETWAFKADEVHGLFCLDPAQLTVDRGSSQSSTYSRGLFGWGDEEVTLLDDELVLSGLKRVIQ